MSWLGRGFGQDILHIFEEHGPPSEEAIRCAQRVSPELGTFHEGNQRIGSIDTEYIYIYMYLYYIYIYIIHK